MTVARSTPVGQTTEITFERSRPRVTPTPAGRQFRESLAEGSSALLDGVESAASLVPAGQVVSTALRGVRQGSDASAPGAIASLDAAGHEEIGPESATRPGAPAGSFVSSQTDESLRFLELQQRISAESRRFSALSNVLKARHDTAKTAINNIR
jgi:hypothetical protein